MDNWRRSATALCLALVLASAPACSDDGGGSTSAPGSTVAWKTSEGGAWNPAAISVDASGLECTGKARRNTRGITDTSIRIGGLGTMSGPTTAIFSDAQAGAKARFERANAEGGVNGRKIDFTGIEDDGLDPSRQVDGARRLVSQDVFAAAPVLSALSNYEQTFCDEVVPHFGWGFNEGWCNNAVAFAITGCIVDRDPKYQGLGTSTVDPLVAGRPKSVAFLGNDEEAARIGNQVVADGFRSTGYKVVYNENPLNPRVPVADASPIVSALMTADDGAPPTFVYLVSDFSNTNTMVSALEAAGYEGTILSAVGYDPRLAGAAQFDGVYTTLQWAPFESTTIPFVKQMVADFDRYAADTARSLPAAAGYVSADMLLAALEEAGRDLTVDGFVQKLNSGWTYSTPEFRGEARFPANHVAAVPCGTLALLKDGKFTQSGPLGCTDPIKR